MTCTILAVLTTFSRGPGHGRCVLSRYLSFPRHANTRTDHLRYRQYQTDTIHVRTCRAQKLPFCQRFFPSRVIRRQFSSDHIFDSVKSGRTPRFSLFTGFLILFGVSATAWTIYEYSFVYSIWPKELRSDLRAGIRAKHRGDLKTSITSLLKAWETARSLPLDALSPEPHLKISGIAIALADVLEANNMLNEAYNVYQQVLIDIRRHNVEHSVEYYRALVSSSGLFRGKALNAIKQLEEPDDPRENTLTVVERARAAALAYRLGGMAEQCRRPTAEREAYLQYAVTEMLRILADNKLYKKNFDWDTINKIDNELHLPPRIMTVDLLAPMEALGTHYVDTGRHDLAYALYSHVIDTMIKQKSIAVVNGEMMCQMAQMFNNLAALLLNNPELSKDDLKQLAHIDMCLNRAQMLAGVTLQHNNELSDPSLCRSTLPAIQYHKAMRLEIEGKKSEAKLQYEKALSEAKKYDSEEGIREASNAIRQLEEEESQESDAH